MTQEEKDLYSQPARLKVSHPDEGGYLRREIHLSLDGKEFVILKSGRDAVTEIAPGHHSLRANNTFLSKAVEFDTRPGEQVHYKTWNRKGFGSWMIEILGSGPLYLVIERGSE